MYLRILDELEYPALLIKNFEIIYENAKAREIYGKVVGKKCYEVIHKTSSPPAECHGMRAILEGRERVEIYEPKVGKWISILLDRERGEFLHILFESPEIAELKKKIAESEKFYQILLETFVPIYIAQGDAFVYVNAKTAELLGYPKEQIIGRSPFDFIHPDDRAKVMDRYEKRLRRERLEESYPIRILTKSGERWVVIRPMRIEYGGKPAVLGVVHEVDELIRQINVLQSIHRMLKHDLKNALSVALMSLELMEEGITGPEKVRSSIMKALEILEHSRIEELKPVDLEEMIRKASSGIGAEVKIEGNCTILADDSLYTVFHNILENAVKHGKATRIDVAIVEKGRDCEVRIADNGVGVPDEIKEKIFEGYSTGGTGTGLKTVREILKNFNGEIWVEDNPGGGAVFVLHFKNRVMAPVYTKIPKAH
jgi:PAS domain S-box-containing protein